MLATFVGCAGVGKNTIISCLLQKYPEVYGTFQTLTTRAMREGESQGKPYYFLNSEEEFMQKIEDGEIYEYNRVHGNLYGGSRKILSAALAGGKILVKDIDVQGADFYKSRLSDLTRILSVFIYIDDPEVLRTRMRGRGDKEEDIEKRCKRFKMEMKMSRNCDYMVSNEVLDDAVEAVNAILRNEEQNAKPFRPAAKIKKIDPAKVAEYEEKLKQGKRIAPVELVYNGQELLVYNGAERYAAALHTGCFVQKKIKHAANPSLKAAEFDF